MVYALCLYIMLMFIHGVYIIYTQLYFYIASVSYQKSIFGNLNQIFKKAMLDSAFLSNILKPLLSFESVYSVGRKNSLALFYF